MELEGLHHLTMISGDAPGTVDFYAETLGLRLVKQTVNFDQPDAYHLYFGDERGSPGSILTWFEFPGAAPGRAGAGMIHTIELGVGATAALDFWADRLTARGHQTERGPETLSFADPDGLALALVVVHDPDPALRAAHPEVPEQHAIVGVSGVRAHPGPDPRADRALLIDTLGFIERAPGAYRLAGPTRRFEYRYDETPARAVPGAGTVHHIAWHARDADHADWRTRVRDAGQHVTPIIDRDYFESIYFRGPQGILFEIATTSPGFAVDEDPAHLGEALRLPAQHEHLRAHLQRALTPLTNPRLAAPA